MIKIIDSFENTVNVALKGDLTIYKAEELNKQFVEIINQHKMINIDFSEVSEIDTSCYQVLLRYQLMSDKDNKIIQIKNMNEQVNLVFGLYGNKFNIDPND